MKAKKNFMNILLNSEFEENGLNIARRFFASLNWQRRNKMAATQNRFYKARRRAREILMACGYRVSFLSDGPFDLEAVRQYELRKIKICLDAATKADREAVGQIELPASCRKEIWIKKPNISTFEIADFSTGVKRKSLAI